MKRRTLLMGAVAAAVVAGIAAYLSLQPAARTIPKLTIYLDRDKCKRCGMVISRLEFAAGLYAEGMDDWWKYDDIRCMMRDYIENSEKVRFLAAAVFDYRTKEELDAWTTYYVFADPKKLWTPMNTGIVALKDRTAAEKIAHDYDGRVYRWVESIEKVKEIIKEMMRGKQQHGGS